MKNDSMGREQWENTFDEKFRLRPKVDRHLEWYSNNYNCVEF